MGTEAMLPRSWVTQSLPLMRETTVAVATAAVKAA